MWKWIRAWVLKDVLMSEIEMADEAQCFASYFISQFKDLDPEEKERLILAASEGFIFGVRTSQHSLIDEAEE